MDLGIVSLHEDGDFVPLHADAGFRDLVRPFALYVQGPPHAISETW